MNTIIWAQLFEYSNNPNIRGNTGTYQPRICTRPWYQHLYLSCNEDFMKIERINFKGEGIVEESIIGVMGKLKNLFLRGRAIDLASIDQNELCLRKGHKTSKNLHCNPDLYPLTDRVKSRVKTNVSLLPMIVCC